MLILYLYFFLRILRQNAATNNPTSWQPHPPFTPQLDLYLLSTILLLFS